MRDEPLHLERAQRAKKKRAEAGMAGSVCTFLVEGADGVDDAVELRDHVADLDAGRLVGPVLRHIHTRAVSQQWAKERKERKRKKAKGDRKWYLK